MAHVAPRLLPPALLSLQDAARVLGVSLRTLRTLAIPLIRVSARRLAITREDLDRYIDSRREPAK